MSIAQVVNRRQAAIERDGICDERPGNPVEPPPPEDSVRLARRMIRAPCAAEMNVAHRSAAESRGDCAVVLLHPADGEDGQPHQPGEKDGERKRRRDEPVNGLARQVSLPPPPRIDRSRIRPPFPRSSARRRGRRSHPPAGRGTEGRARAARRCTARQGWSRKYSPASRGATPRSAADGSGTGRRAPVRSAGSRRQSPARGVRR